MVKARVVAEESRLEMDLRFGYRYLTESFQEALDQLTEKQRQCMILVVIMGYTQAECAEGLWITRETVKDHLAASIKKLSTILQ